ncbi:hypothetical protein MKD49_12440 [Herbaspirillum sp. WGmk3]|uniref:hypothetical protein n=1 Tax=Herbaspirillum sp. WGmk3 TaxID=2919925 RepID=UPI002090D320|nr:hypothetical protein [Herbaspirillum sp. WGmk3]MCO4857288.1 hypothetical protein [Herbaspirillum sp. WGmk3]
MTDKIPTQEDVIAVFDAHGVRDMRASTLRLKLVEQGFGLVESTQAMDRAISRGALIRTENEALQKR